MDDNLLAVERFIELLLALVLLATVSLLIVKFKNVWLQTQTERYGAKHQDYFDYVAAHLHEGSSIAVPNSALNKLELQVIQHKLFAWMEQIHGEHRARLTDLCRRLGLVELHLAKLRSGVHSEQVDAAYNLGVLRCHEAVPGLLELLAKEKHHSSRFVIARAIAKCAVDISEVRSMLRLLAEQRTNAPELVADILLDCSVEYMPLMLELLRTEDEPLIKIGLIAVQGQNNPEVTEALEQFAKQGEKDVRVKAVQAWTKQSAFMSPRQMAELMQDDDWEVRAETAKAAGALGSPVFVEMLKEAVRDEDWRVRYHSAMSLAKLSEAGFQALCEVAVSSDNRPSADMAQAVIQDYFWKGEHHA